MKKALPLLGLAVVLLLGGIARGYEYGRSLWLDEAWVANSVRTGTWEGLFFYPRWLQTSPPLFLVVEKLTGEWVGWRAQSWLFGMASIWLAYLLGRRVAGEWAGLAAAVTVAGSKWAVAFAKDAKQYSGELFFGLALLWAAVSVDQSDKRKWWLWPLLTAVAVGFGYPGLFYVPGLLAVLWWRGERKAAIAVALAAGVTAALIAVVLAARNTSPLLKEAWAHSYPPPLVEIDRWLRFFWRGTRAAIEGSVWFPVAFGVAAVGAVWTRWWIWLGLGALPFAMAMGASALGLYPYGYERFVFHLLAAMVVLVALAMAAVPERARGVVVVALIGVLAWRVALHPEDWAPRHRDGTEAALRYLRNVKQVPAADLLYVHAVGAETFRYYRAGLAAEVVTGEAGAPCCPRPAPGEDPKVKMMDPVFFREDFEGYVARGAARRMWFLYTHFAVQWRALGRNDEVEHQKLLAARGCRQEERREFPNVSLSAYWCPL